MSQKYVLEWGILGKNGCITIQNKHSYNIHLLILDCWRNMEYPEETHETWDEGRTCMARGWIQTPRSGGVRRLCYGVISMPDFHLDRSSRPQRDALWCLEMHRAKCRNGPAFFFFAAKRCTLTPGSLTYNDPQTAAEIPSGLHASR